MRRPLTLTEFCRRLAKLARGPEPGKNLADFIGEEVDSMSEEERAAFVRAFNYGCRSAGVELVVADKTVH